MDAKKLQRFSEYSIGTYLLCPKKYRYIYIEKLYTKQKRKINKYFIFGNVIHLACREFYQKRAEERTIENLYNIFREGWRRSGIKIHARDACGLHTPRETKSSAHSSAV